MNYFCLGLLKKLNGGLHSTLNGNSLDKEIDFSELAYVAPEEKY